MERHSGYKEQGTIKSCAFPSYHSTQRSTNALAAVSRVVQSRTIVHTPAHLHERKAHDTTHEARIPLTAASLLRFGAGEGKGKVKKRTG